MAFVVINALLIGLLVKYALATSDNSIQYIGPKIVSEGDPFAISCITTFHDTSSWTVNGSIVVTDENIYGYELIERRLYSVFKEMIIRSTSAQLYQTGQYRCNGKSRNYHFLRVVEDAEADTTEDPVVTDSPTNKHKRDGGDRYPKRYNLQLNTNYEFNCEAEDEDYPVLWYKNMNQINAFTSPNLELYDQQLIIHNARLEDVGEYTCRLDASFQPGQRDVVSRYLLTSPAQIVDMSEKQNVIRGRSMTLYCRAEGYPSPRISWYIRNMNAFMLKEKDLRISVYSKRERVANAYLTVRNMTNFDTGVYTCRAENGIGIDRENKYHEKSIPVYVRENIIEPNEDEPGRGKILVPGEPLVLQCKTEECPYCSIVWFREGGKLSSVENIIHVDEENNTLIIHSATLNDTGLYECAVNRELLNVDLRASVIVQTCEELLSKGLEIESICEMPAVADLSISRASFPSNSAIRMLILILVASVWRKMIVL